MVDVEPAAELGAVRLNAVMRKMHCLFFCGCLFERRSFYEKCPSDRVGLWTQLHSGRGQWVNQEDVAAIVKEADE